MPDPAVVVTPDPTGVAWFAAAVAPPMVEQVIVGAVTEAMLSQVPVMWTNVPAGMVAPVVLTTARGVPADVPVPLPSSPRLTTATVHPPSPRPRVRWRCR